MPSDIKVDLEMRFQSTHPGHIRYMEKFKTSLTEETHLVRFCSTVKDLKIKISVDSQKPEFHILLTSASNMEELKCLED